jgi:hypothetical protein
MSVGPVDAAEVDVAQRVIRARFDDGYRYSRRSVDDTRAFVGGK